MVMEEEQRGVEKKKKKKKKILLTLDSRLKEGLYPIPIATRLKHNYVFT